MQNNDFDGIIFLLVNAKANLLTYSTLLTEYATLHLTDYIHYEMDIGKTPVNLYLDFSKTFDTLVHSVLLHKCIHYGIDGLACIDGLAYKLFESYLENRKQYAEFNAERSDIKS